MVCSPTQLLSLAAAAGVALFFPFRALSYRHYLLRNIVASDFALIRPSTP